MNNPHRIEKKKTNELKQLRIFYPESDYKIIRYYENPDFILKDNKNNIFGVEVTQYYDTPTSGRLKNLPKYADNLINKKYIHKGDIGILEVIEDMVKINNDGTETPLPKGVLRSLPQSPDRINILKELVASKNSKFNNYDKSLRAIDLLIFDCGDLMAGLEIQKNQILNYLRQQEKANSLRSPFRKIILVIEEPSKEIIIILLKSS